MDYVSVGLVLVMVYALYRGYRIGFGRALLPTVGGLIGLVIGIWLVPSAAALFSRPLDQVIVSCGVALLCAVVGVSIGEIVGFKLDGVSRKLHLGILNGALGALARATFILFLLWLVAAGLSGVQAYGIGRAVQNSVALRALNRTLPPPPDVITGLQKIINPNGFPNVFIGNEPFQTPLAPAAPVTNEQIAVAEQSVVQVAGRGCGGQVEGSGFVVSPGVVVTNAHVVAGVTRPRVLYSHTQYAATVVWFDANEDLAVLRVANLAVPPLVLDATALKRGDAAAIIGYPDGGPLTIGDAVVLGQTRALGQNIYNKGSVQRTIYELSGSIQPGNSGGPLVTAQGTVAGIVFAKSVSQDNVGYALTTSEVEAAINQAKTKTTAVATGQCAAE